MLSLLMLWLLKTNDLLRYGHYSMCKNNVEWKFFDKNEKKSLFQFLLNLKLENICELMQKTASPYLSPFQNGGRMKLTCTAILLYKNGHFLGQTRV